MNRGEIINIERARQINNFKNMRYGKITPTDMDGLIEYHNKAYVFIEVKYGDKDLPFGQRLALERLVKDTSSKDKQSIAIVCEHQVENTENQIDVADCKVREIFLSSENKWRPPNASLRVKELLDMFINILVDKKF